MNLDEVVGEDRSNSESIAVLPVVLDLNLPDNKGVETFDKLFQAAPGVPILILSEADSELATA
jgi:DNA-binding response OmpR family regulator